VENFAMKYDVMKQSTKIMLLFILAAFSLFFFGLKRTEPLEEARTSSTGMERVEPSQPIEHAVQMRPPTKLALLVGINKYRHAGGIPALAGCVNDVENMKSLLIGKFDFREENILVLVDEMATREAIIAAFQKHLITKAQRGDIVVLHYSGYGSQMKDLSGDEPNGFDETIVPHDSRDPAGKIFDLSDDEINGLFRLLSQKTKKITIIFDSSYSGVAARAAGQWRSLPPDQRQPPAPDASNQRGYGEGENDLRSANLISASKLGEHAFEHWVEGKAHGAMTYFLARELRRAGAAATYRKVMDNVIGKVNALYPQQHPQLEFGRADDYVFSDSTGLAQPFVPAAPLGTNQAVLRAGRLQELAAGSIFDVYNPGAKKFEETIKPLAKIQLTKVEALTSEGRLISGKRVLESSRAVERVHRYADFKLNLYYKDLANSVTLQSLKKKLDLHPFIQPVSQERGYHLLLRQLGSEIVAEGGDTTEVLPRVAAGAPDAAAQVASQVIQRAQWLNLLAVVNTAPALDLEFTIKAFRNGRSREPFARPDEVMAVIYEGERVECKLVNTSKKNLYFALFDLTGNGNVSVIYPPPGQSAAVLAGGKPWTERFPALIPKGRESTQKIWKVFASTMPMDFQFLAQPARSGLQLPRTMQHDFGKLLANAALGMARRDSLVALGNWVTAQRVFEVRK
jgi:hypothetical protein